MANTDIQNSQFGRILTDKDGNQIGFEAYGVAALIIEKRKNLETGLYSYKLANANAPNKTTIIKVEDLADKNLVLKKVFNIDCLFSPIHYNAFFESLLLQENNPQRFPIQKVFEFENLGWLIIPDTDILVYRSDKLITKKNYSAEYTGKYLLEPAGDFNVWLEMIKKYVLGYTTLELTLIAALSAIIVGILSLITPVSNIILSLASSTTSGKSTMLACCTSCFSKVTDSPIRVNGQLKRSTLSSWNATDSAMLQQLSGNFGCNICIDERGCSSVSDVGKLIYAVSNSSTKLRNNSIIDTEIAEGFATSVISAGEVGILTDTEQKMGGLDIRLVEVTDPLTQSAEQADAIKDVSTKHYGFAKNIMAKSIIDNGGIDFVKSCYDKWLKCAQYAMPHNNLSTRFSRTFVSPLMVTAEIAEKSMGLKFNKIAVLKYLAEYCKKFEKKQSEVEAFDTIIEKCKVNANKFLNRYTSEKNIPLEIWGRYAECYGKLSDGREVVGEFWVYKIHLNELLKNCGFKNPQTCVKKWKQAGFIDADEGHCTNKRKIANNYERCYVLRVFAADNTTVQTSQNLFDITQLPEGDTTYTFGNIMVDFETGVSKETTIPSVLKVKKTNREILFDDEDDGVDFLIDPETGEVLEIA